MPELGAGRTNVMTMLDAPTSNWPDTKSDGGHTEWMRAPKRRRPLPRSLVTPPEGVRLDELAERVSYVGSGEHKSYPSFAGQPRLRADASKCDPKFTDPVEITD